MTPGVSDNEGFTGKFNLVLLAHIFSCCTSAHMNGTFHTCDSVYPGNRPGLISCAVLCSAFSITGQVKPMSTLRKTWD